MPFINLLECLYPVGSVYISISATSPASIIGGTWTSIEAGTTLGAAGEDFPSNNYNGSAIISSSQIPAHTHGTGQNGFAFQICRSLSSDSTARRYFNAASGGTQVMISALTSASDYGGIDDITTINYTTENTDAGGEYYPKQYGVYMWIRTA